VHKKLSLLTALLLTCSSAMATDWTSIIKNAEYEVYVDIDSYGVSEQLPFLVAKTIYQQPQYFVSANQKIEYAISIATLQYNCEKPLYRMRTIKLLDKKSKPIKTFKIKAHFKKLASNTDAFSIGQLTCQVHQMLGGSELMMEN
jgi:hypothetical protein